MKSPLFITAAVAAFLPLCARPLMAAGDSTLRYPAANDVVLSTVCWTGNQFVAAGQGGVIFTSPDGTAWTSRHSPVAVDWRASAAGGGTVVLAGDSRAVVTSTDGIAWTVQALTDTYQGLMQGAAWNGSTFMVSGSDGGRSFTSPNGSTWTNVAETGPFPMFKGLAVNGNSFVSLESFSDSRGDRQRLWIFNGVTWSPEELDTHNLDDLTWTGTRYIAAGTGGAAATSVDGIAWTPRTTGVTADLKKVIWSGNQAVAVGDGGTILTSPNGATWTVQTSGTTRNLKSVAWSGTRYAAVGEGGLILTSPSGTAWQPAKTGTPPPVAPGFLGWTGTSGLAVGGGKTLFSADGNTWVQTAATGGPLATGPLFRPRFRLATGAGRVVVAATDFIPYSTPFGHGGLWSAPLDGSAWTPIAIRASNEGFSAFWTGSQFAVLGVQQVIEFGSARYTYFKATSSNGTVWSEGADSPLRPETTDLVWTGQNYMTTRGWWATTSGEWTFSNTYDNRYLFWTGDKFAGVTSDGKISTSADGLTWPVAQFPIVGGADDVLWTGSRLLAVNRYGVYEATLQGPWQEVCPCGGQSIAWTGTRALIATGSKVFSLEGVGVSAYGQWLGTHFSPAQLLDPAIAGQLADPDHDQQPNLVEYATGTDPSNTSQSPDITVEKSAGFVRFRWPQDMSRTDVRVTPQVSFDLDAWDNLAGTPFSGTPGGVRVMETAPLASQASAYFRLKVESLESGP